VEIIENFLTANSKAEVFGVLADHCREIGFSYCVYSPLIVAGDAEKVFKDESKIVAREALVAQNTFISCPDSWLHRYQEARHSENDPVLKHVSKSILPIFWDDASQSQPKNIVLTEAKDHGLAQGVTVSVYGHGGQRAVLSFSTDKRCKESRAQKIMTASVVQMTANHVHEAIRKVDDSQPSLPTLSVREKDCLRWAAGGKTSWEIAQILKISERTVIFHLANAAKKLQATNRRQAVVRALTLRLINP
jgi:DNA-binding CsgD family transcriptional regulator